jgi:hypothetical protein
LGWGILLGIQPSPVTHFYFGCEILDRMTLGILISIRYPDKGSLFIRVEVQVLLLLEKW